jgi:hypothetical protein
MTDKRKSCPLPRPPKNKQQVTCSPVGHSLAHPSSCVCDQHTHWRALQLRQDLGAPLSTRHVSSNRAHLRQMLVRVDTFIHIYTQLYSYTVIHVTDA